MVRVAVPLIVLFGLAAALFAHPGVGIVMDSRGNVFYTPDGTVSMVARNLSRRSLTQTGGMVAPNGDGWILESLTTNAVRVRRIHKRHERIWQ